MLRSASLAAVSVLALSSLSLADVWVVGNTGTGNDFYSVADAMGSGSISDGDTLRILSGQYGSFDTGNTAVRIEPGNSPGIIDVYGNMSVRHNSTVNFELSGLNSGLSVGDPQFDQFIVTGHVFFAGDIEISLFGGFIPSLGNSFALIQAGQSLSFTGIVTILPVLADGLSWDISVNPGVSSDSGLSGGYSLVASVVPAPSAVALIGMAGLIVRRRRA